MFFSKKDLNFDFLSKVSEFKIIVKSSTSLVSRSAIIFKILSVALLIIMVLASSNKDLEKVFLPQVEDIVNTARRLASY